MSNNQSYRKIIFETDDPNYRAVCTIGDKSFLGNVWWCRIEKRYLTKKWILFGRTVYFWKKTDYCWFSKKFESVDDLKRSALNFYYERIKAYSDLKSQNINIQ